MFIGGLVRSAATDSADGQWSPTHSAHLVGAAATGGIIATGGAAGLLAGRHVANRLFQGRRASAAMAIGAVLGGGLPVLSSWIGATGCSGSETVGYDVGYATAAVASGGRMLTSVGRDMANNYFFHPSFLGGVDPFDGGVKLAPDLRESYDVKRLLIGQVGYTVSSFAHLWQLREVLTERFGFQDGPTFEELFLSNFGTLNSSILNEVWDDFQAIFIQAALCTALGYELRYRRAGASSNPGEQAAEQTCCSKAAKAFILALKHTSMRIAGFAPAELAITLALQYCKGSQERTFLLILAAALMGMTH